jgi:hypothetical protein
VHLEDVSDAALRSIATGFIRREVEQGRAEPTMQVGLGAVRFCYLQLLKIQNSELRLGIGV